MASGFNEICTRNSGSTEETSDFGKCGKDSDILSQILNDKWSFLDTEVGQGIPGEGNRLCLGTEASEKVWRV